MKPHWQQVLRLGVLRWGLSPHEVWALSLTEFRALMGQDEITPPPRARLDALTALFPD